MGIIITYAFLVTVFVTSAAFIVRIVMTLAGILKGPLLATFQRYGDEEPVYYPLPALLLWLGLFLFSGVTLFIGPGRPFLITDVFTLLLLFAAHLTYQHDQRIIRFMGRFPTLPSWFDALKRMTDRPERRRIAYMWLRLPGRTRLIYNTNDRAFFIWAELVILGTVSDA